MQYGLLERVQPFSEGSGFSAEVVAFHLWPEVYGGAGEDVLGGVRA